MIEFNNYALRYEPPFDWSWMLRFLSLHLSAGVELVQGGHYMRTVLSRNGVGIIDVFQPEYASNNELTVMVSNVTDDESDEILKHLRNLFDIDFMPEIALSCLDSFADQNPGMRVPGAFDNFETAVRIILGQLVSVQSANTFMRRYIQEFGIQCNSPVANLNFITPYASNIAAVNASDLAHAIKIPLQKAVAIVNLAAALAEGRLHLEETDDPESTIKMLETIPGIGAWTAHTIAMRVLHWADAFPHGDLGIRKALRLKKKGEILAAAERWRPWRAYATMHLWNSINAFPL